MLKDIKKLIGKNPPLDFRIQQKYYSVSPLSTKLYLQEQNVQSIHQPIIGCLVCNGGLT
jgi:hypothetical protein